MWAPYRRGNVWIGGRWHAHRDGHYYDHRRATWIPRSGGRPGHYSVGGRWLKGLDAGRALPSARALRWFNELPVLLLVAIVFLVLAKPF